MFYLTRNFERQKLRLQKAKKIYNADADADVNANADAEMPMPRFGNGQERKIKKSKSIYLIIFQLKFVRMKKFL